MLSLGLADLKGHVGIGYDEGAWLDSAYNAALMFIGPFSVYLGGLLGPRRILLFAAGVFTVTCAFLPLIHSYSLLVAALIVAGLTSGTFYPLTLTFALRNIPLRFLPFTIAFYATFVDGAVNIAPSLYGWYRDHLSWHWMFWNSALIAPVMMICIYLRDTSGPSPKKGRSCAQLCGVPVPERRTGHDVCCHPARTEARLVALRSIQRIVLVWLVPASVRARAAITRSQPAGGAPLSLAMEHGAAGHPAVLVSVYSHRNHHPDSAVAGYSRLRSRSDWAGRNLERCSPVARCVYRCAPAASQTGSSPVDGCRLYLHRLRRCLNAEYTSAWSAANYYRTELLMGVGQAFAFIGLVGCIVLQGVFSGGLAKPQWILTFSAFFHTIRLFGGTTGAVYMGHFLADREKLHSNLLGLHVTRGSWITDGNLHALAAGVYAKSSGAAAAAAACCRSDRGPAAPSGLCLEPHRRVPSSGMGLRPGPSFDRVAAQVAAELRRPQHAAAG